MSDLNTMKDIVIFTSMLEQMLLENGGEITEDILPYLKVKEIDLPEKVDSTDFIIERMKFISKFYSDKADVYQKLSQAADKIVEYRGEGIKDAMIELGVKELKGHDVKFVLQNSPPSVEINNEELIDEAYKETKTIVSINKKKISEDLKIGVPVAGAQLKQSQHVRRYLNTPGTKGVKKND